MAKIYAAKSAEVSPREERNMALARGIAAQGMVLLENKGALPLSGVKTIAAFGSGVRHTVKGGTGSGDVNSRVVLNVEQGLLDAGLTLTNGAWLGRYDEICSKIQAEEQEKIRTLMAEGGIRAVIHYVFTRPNLMIEVPEITAEDLLPKADTAIYVIARNSGEGADRRPVPGDYELTDHEKQNLLALSEVYENLIVILNVGGVIDTKFIRALPNLGALLLMSQAGNITGPALADVLFGKAVPSGHLSTTWAENYEDYPSSDTFSFRNGDTDDEYYYEGIYVGYRYFDSFNIAPAYPFGYGLNYTDFSISEVTAALDGSDLLVCAAVKNIGEKYPGRESVQVYVSAPKGGLEKPYQELKGFAKTKELAPGECEAIQIRIPLSSMASYCERCASWVLEPGKYYIRVGENSRSTQVAAAVEIPERKVVSVLKNKAVPDEEFELLHPDCAPYSYAEEEAEKAAAPVLTADLAAIPTEIAEYSVEPQEMTTDKTDLITLQDVVDGKADLSEFVAQLTVEEMAELCIGTARRDGGGSPTIGAQSLAVPGAAGDTTSILYYRGVPNIALADGPAGLRLQKHFITDAEGNVTGLGNNAFGGLAGGPAEEEKPEGAVDYYQYCTAIPIATMLAQTFDMNAVEQAGDIVGGEMEEFHVALWLAPGMNIHRNPLCGRNFEYYSEDPFLAGQCAAADTRGVQKHKGCGTCIKHYALNNNEDNRQGCNAHVTERAIREIYLKGFEIAVRESQPLSLMTSYNLINGEHAANKYDTVSAILRDEWGFKGVVMTDWSTTGPQDGSDGKKYHPSDAAACIKAGNDLTMPGSMLDYNSIVSSVGAKEGEVFCPITKAELQLCTYRILKVIIACEMM
ncbi:MAG: glycoside hydrolase family 3 protein [Lachnospiraceae bacterium]|nr:glycoside hydrolase family 3 protein [Lachnospiraceae bacterium]